MSSRRYDSPALGGQSSGIGVIAKNDLLALVERARARSSIAPPNARRKTGVQRMSSGSSARPMRSCSRQNASIRAFSARQKSSRSSRRPGARAAIASSTPRTRRASSSGRAAGRPAPGRPQVAGEPDHLGPDGRELAIRPARMRSGVSVSERIVWRILRANSSGPSRASPSLAGRTTSRRCVSKAAERGRRRRRRPSRGAGRTAATAASSAASSACGQRRRRSAPRCPAAARARSRSGTARPAARGSPTSILARRVEQRRQALEPTGDRRQPLGEGRELAGDAAGRARRRAGTPSRAGSRPPRAARCRRTAAPRAP